MDRSSGIGRLPVGLVSYIAAACSTRRKYARGATSTGSMVVQHRRPRSRVRKSGRPTGNRSIVKDQQSRATTVAGRNPPEVAVSPTDGGGLLQSNIPMSSVDGRLFFQRGSSLELGKQDCGGSTGCPNALFP